MNDSEESLECLKLEIIADSHEDFPTELPKTLPSERFVHYHIDLLQGESFSLKPRTDPPSLRPMRLRNLFTNFSPEVTFALVRLHGLLLCFLPPRWMESYDFALITEH